MTTKVTEAQDLLIYELQAALGMENQIIAALPEMRREANDRELAAGLEQHLAETRGHARRVTEALGLLGESPAPLHSAAIEGLERQHASFVAAAGDDIGADVLDAELVGAAGAVEHHEIATYESLISMAEIHDLNEVADLLRTNLAEEQHMLTEGKQIARRIARSTAHAAR